MTHSSRPSFEIGACSLPDDAPRIGVLCSYCPEEVIYAAGLQPVRLVGSGLPIARADSYLHNNLCPYVRGLFDAALAGDCDEVAGVVFVNSCDAMRRLNDVWRKHGRQRFVHMLDLLRIDTGDAVEYFADQLRDLAAALGAQFGRAVDDAAMSAAIRDVNRTRSLIARLYALRAAQPPHLSGTEAFPILLAGVRSEAVAFDLALERFMAEVAAVPGHHHRGKPRLLVTGSVIHHPQVIALSEEAGAVVVAEDVCVGHRHYDGPVAEQGDPFRAIAERYIRRVACARMKDIARRQAYVGRLIDRFHVDGVVYHALKFCDLYQYDYPPMQQVFDGAGIPALYIESAYSTGSYGQLKTRLQAFVEVLA